MIEKIIFGTVSLKIDGFDAVLLSEKLYESCKVISLYNKGDSLFLTVLGSQFRKVKEICEAEKCVIEIIETHGFIFTLKKYFRRFGFAAGIIAVSALIFYLSNVVMKIEIVGSADEAAKAEIREILNSEGIHAGSYIPALNFLKISSALISQSENVAWASIGNIGSVVYVNVNMSTNKTEVENNRIPSNIISDKDAVIVKAEVLAGQLKVLVGDAVYKGQILVSGIVEYASGSAKYFRSKANIIGRYDEHVEFTQKYSEISQIRGEKIYRHSLEFFELDIPLPSGLLRDGANYEVKTKTTPVRLLGFTLPIAVTTSEYTELIENEKNFSTDEALKSLYRRVGLYEKNMLKDKNIISKDVLEVKDDDGVTVSVDYVLEGEIGMPSEIYID